MNFKRVIKRKVYPTWVSTTKIKGCKAYVYYMPENYYHFRILCESGVSYNSLVDNSIFNDFEECCKAVEKYIKNKI